MRTVKNISDLRKMYKIKIPKTEDEKKQENFGKLNKIRKNFVTKSIKEEMIKKKSNEEIDPKPSISRDCIEEIQEEV